MEEGLFSLKEKKPVSVLSRLRHKLLLANQVCSFLIVEAATDCGEECYGRDQGQLYHLHIGLMSSLEIVMVVLSHTR